MSGDTCLCPASGAKPKISGFKGGGLGDKYVQLNVGGSLYYTTVRALTRHDTMLKAMFSGRMEVLTDKEGEALHPGMLGKGEEGSILRWLQAGLEPNRSRIFSSLIHTRLTELQMSLKLYIECYMFIIILRLGVVTSAALALGGGDGRIRNLRPASTI